MNGAPSAMVSPGLWGFLAFFVLAIVLYLLMRNMNARMRRMSYRSEELQRQAEAQEREREQERERGRDRDGETGDDDGVEGQTGDPRT